MKNWILITMVIMLCIILGIAIAQTEVDLDSGTTTYIDFRI